MPGKCIRRDTSRELAGGYRNHRQAHLFRFDGRFNSNWIDSVAIDDQNHIPSLDVIVHQGLGGVVQEPFCSGMSVRYRQAGRENRVDRYQASRSLENLHSGHNVMATRSEDMDQAPCFDRPGHRSGRVLEILLFSIHDGCQNLLGHVTVLLNDVPGRIRRGAFAPESRAACRPPKRQNDRDHINQFLTHNNSPSKVQHERLIGKQKTLLCGTKSLDNSVPHVMIPPLSKNCKDSTGRKNNTHT